jgi:hypothetical protein
MQALHKSATETETVRELFIQIRELRRAQLLDRPAKLLARLYRAQAGRAKSCARRGQPQSRTIVTAPAGNPGVGNNSGNVPGFPSAIHRTGVFHSAKQGRRRRRRSECDALGVSSFAKFRRPFRIYDLVHPHRVQLRSDAGENGSPLGSNPFRTPAKTMRPLGPKEFLQHSPIRKWPARKRKPFARSTNCSEKCVPRCGRLSRWRITTSCPSKKRVICSASLRERSSRESSARGNISSDERNVPSWPRSGARRTRRFLQAAVRSQLRPKALRIVRLQKLRSDDEPDEPRSRGGTSCRAGHQLECGILATLKAWTRLRQQVTIAADLF